MTNKDNESQTTTDFHHAETYGATCTRCGCTLDAHGAPGLSGCRRFTAPAASGGAPEWLRAGALIDVRPASSTRAPLRTERVASLEWPYVVYLDGVIGGVHPDRCRPHVAAEVSP